MKKLLSNLRRQDFLYVFLMLVIGALAYLLYIKRLGFYGDDWYIIFDAHTQGSTFLNYVFSSDRPAEGRYLSLAYALFGEHLIWYHLISFFYRYLAALAFFWILNRVWPARKEANFLIGLFFLLYPGYLMQIEPMVYQVHSLSICLAMVSIALTVKAMRTKTIISKLILWIVAGITAWIYLSLLEYHIGMEFLRVFFVACMVWQEMGETLKQKLSKVFVRWLPFSIIPMGFLIWRVFIFKSTRDATDVSLQLGTFFASPLHVGLQWLVNMLYGVFTTIFSAWVVPFYNIVVIGGFRLRDTLLILAAGTGTVVVVFLVLRAVWPRSQDEQVNMTWIRQALWGGLMATFVSVIPIIIANRTVDIEGSRYTLAGAPGAIIMIVAGISLLRSRRVQLGLVCLLTFLSVTTHFGNALNHVYQTDSLRDFWWQVSWRAPKIEAGTNLVASYSLMQTPEDYVIWGPANLIYFPEKQSTNPITIQLPASIPTGQNIINIISHGNGRDMNRRGNITREDFSAVLVLTQPATDSCVRILDGSMPELSPRDSFGTMLIAPYSLIGNVNWDTTPPILPSAIFGQEPAHRWCYYYEKAALASQMEDWSTVIALGAEAAEKGFQPFDIVEWTPFLRAYVATKQLDELKLYRDIMDASSFVIKQTCQILKQTADETHPGDLELTTVVEEQFCP